MAFRLLPDILRNFYPTFFSTFSRHFVDHRLTFSRFFSRHTPDILLGFLDLFSALTRHFSTLLVGHRSILTVLFYRHLPDIFPNFSTSSTFFSVPTHFSHSRHIVGHRSTFTRSFSPLSRLARPLHGFFLGIYPIFLTSFVRHCCQFLHDFFPTFFSAFSRLLHFVKNCAFRFLRY